MDQTLLWLHPVMQVFALLLGGFAMWQGLQRVAMSHFKKKIIFPWKIINFCCKFSDNFFGPVCRTGITDKNFVYNFFHGFQDTRQYFFFIFYNHTKAERNHGR